MRRGANAKSNSKIRLQRNADFQMLENSPSKVLRRELPRVSKHPPKLSLLKLRAARTKITNYYWLKSKRLKLSLPHHMKI